MKMQNKHTDILDMEELVTLQSSAQAEIMRGAHKPLPLTPIGEQTKAVRRQILMVVLGNVGLLSSGMGLGLPAVTLKPLTDINEAFHLTLSQATWFASLNSLSCPLGGILSGFILDSFGRKKTLFVYNILALIAWALMALAVETDEQLVYIQLLLSRFMMGIAIGLASAPVGVYAAEISLPKMRSHLILGSSIAIAAGIMFVYILGYFIRDNWHSIATICCIYQIGALICLFPLLETPNWLVSKGYLDEAISTLNYFRGLPKTNIISHPEVLAEFNLLQKTIQLGAGERKPTLLEVIRLPEVYKPTIILMSLFAFQQLTGIFVVIVYAVQISTAIGMKIDPFICAVLLGMARLVTTCPMGIILSKLGRRKAGMISAAGIFVCMHLLAMYSWFETLRSIPYMAVITIVLYMVLSTIGLYTLPFIMISELFPQKARGPASGLTVAVGLFISFICVKTFPALKTAIGIELIFVLFGMMGLLAFAFIYFFLPETRGRTLLEIEEKFREGKFKSNMATAEMQEVLSK